MAKGFFIVIFVLLFGGIAFGFAAQLDILPAPLYDLWYQLEMRTPILRASIPPYFMKYEGTWLAVFQASRVNTDIGDCKISDGFLHVHAGTMSGSIGPFGSALPFSATTTPDGLLSGVYGGPSSLRHGQIKAVFNGTDGKGYWSDTSECSGTVVFTKQDEVFDPVVGKIVSFSGDVDFIRAGVKGNIVPGMVLYVGDVIEARRGTVLLGLGQDFGIAIPVPLDSTYKVTQ